MPQARTLHPDLSVGQLQLAGLRSVPADLTAGLAGRTRSRDLLGTQGEDGFQRLDVDFVDHLLHYLAGVFDEVDQRKQDLPVRAAELFDNGR